MPSYFIHDCLMPGIMAQAPTLYPDMSRDNRIVLMQCT